MIPKRLIGVVTVKDGWAVQSVGYRRWLPLGRPETLVENLDRWGADEILLQCIDRSARKAGPDLALLEKIGRSGLSTPLIYAGGIRDASDAVAVVKSGADRVCIDALLRQDLGAAARLAEPLGAQAVIAALPLAIGESGPEWLDHRSGRSVPLPQELRRFLGGGTVSEVLVTDWRHEGHREAFDFRLLDLPFLRGLSLIAFGGLSEAGQLRRALSLPQVAAVAVGNFLSYREHAIQRLKKDLAGLPLRPAAHAGTERA